MADDESSESEVAEVAVAFANALFRNDWIAAHSLLAPPLRDDWQPADLKKEYEEMISYWDKPPNSVELCMVNAGRAYVAIGGLSDSYGSVQEGVDVRVVCVKGRWMIDHIVWGRP